MPWLSELVTTDKDTQRNRDFRLTQPLSYETWEGETLTVPKNFLTDFSSVPRLMWWLYPPFVSRKSATLHDYNYREQPAGMTRKRADQLFYEGMVDSDIPKYRARILWSGVRSGGWMTWRKHRKRLENVARKRR